MRNYAREVAFAKNYQWLISNEYDEDSFEMFDTNKLTEEDLQFVKQLNSQIQSNVAEINKSIATLTKGYTLDRIFKIDLALMQIAIAEIEYLDTPPAVAINEAVSLAKRYSTKNSVSFVNGVLAQYLRNKQ